MQFRSLHRPSQPCAAMGDFTAVQRCTWVTDNLPFSHSAIWIALTGAFWWCQVLPGPAWLLRCCGRCRHALSSRAQRQACRSAACRRLPSRVSVRAQRVPGDHLRAMSGSSTNTYRTGACRTALIVTQTRSSWTGHLCGPPLTPLAICTCRAWRAKACSSRVRGHLWGAAHMPCATRTRCTLRPARGPQAIPPSGHRGGARVPEDALAAPQGRSAGVRAPAPPCPADV